MERFRQYDLHELEQPQITSFNFTLLTPINQEKYLGLSVHYVIILIVHYLNILVIAGRHTKSLKLNKKKNHRST